MKFKNPGEQTVRVALLTGHIAVFEPGETLEVPDLMKSECLAKNLTLIVEEGEEATKPAAKKKAAAKPAAEPANGDDETVLKVGE